MLAQALNVEQARFAVESIQDTAQTVEALRGGVAEGKRALGQGAKQLDLAAIDRLRLRWRACSAAIRARRIGAG